MTKLRISEIYLSIQGEGPRTGEQTIFVRFAGCNLRCPGWPCDSPHAIFPEKYRQEWESLTPEEVFDKIRQVDDGRNANICFTGGEPFLQNHESLEELVLNLWEGRTLEVFSNGTIEYPDWAFEYLYFIMDWKLPGSGESEFDQVRFKNLARLQPGDAVKFVCAGREDYEMATHLWRTYIEEIHPNLTIYAGVVWGKLDNATLVAWMLDDKLPWSLNVQVHNHIWPVNERAR